LIAGYHSWHARLEAKLADFKGTEAALLCTSGYTANIGAIMALVGPGDAIFSDALNHASLIDGCRLSRADVEVYRHGDCEHLETLLKATRARRKLIVTDSLFSMDGDWAPLEIIAELADRYGCMLMVDEAHATGVFGQRGRGVCETLAVESAVHVRIATLSKALGSIGGVVAGSKPLIEWLVNRARPYIFSTASPSAVAAASMASLEVVDSEPWRRTELLAEASRLREGLRAQEWDVGQSRSQIIPIIVGPSARALELSAKLRAQGYWVPAIRPPSVPVGQARLRISLCYGHSETMVCGLIEALASLR
jgi:8-amino-7-oxononanoate synthase